VQHKTAAKHKKGAPLRQSGEQAERQSTLATGTEILAQVFTGFHAFSRADAGVRCQINRHQITEKRL